MPNKNYIKGRRKEYKLIKELKEKGFDIAFRSAGSHSPIDVVGIDIKNKRIILFQSKPDGYKSEKIYKEWGALSDEFIVRFYVV